MRTKSFHLRREPIFPTEAQKLKLEKLFFIVRLLSNRYNNRFNNVIPGLGYPRPMTYQYLEKTLIEEMSLLDSATPGTLGWVIDLPSQILKPCLLEIEYRQRLAKTNHNRPVRFIYPYQEQDFWLYDPSGLQIDQKNLLIPGESSLLLPLEKTKLNGQVRLAQIGKRSDGSYFLTALYETFQEQPIIKDSYLNLLVQYLLNSERNDYQENRNSYMRQRVRRTQATEGKGFLQRRAVFTRLAQLSSFIPETDDLSDDSISSTFEKEDLCLL